MDPILYQALKKGDDSSWISLPEKAPLWRDYRTAQGNSILHIAASINYNLGVLGMLYNFIDQPLPLFAVNSKGDTPLHCAARAGKGFLVEFLIESSKRSGCQLDLHEMRNGSGNTPLHEAVRNCHLGVASELMKADAQLGLVLNDFGESAVYLAAERGDVEIVRMLMRFPNCAVSGPNGQTALHAAVCRNYEIAELLLQARPGLSDQVDATLSSPLHYAASTGDHNMIHLMLQYDSSTAYLLDKDGSSSIHLAATMGYIDVIKEIIKHCPDAVELTDKKGRNFLHVAIENKRSNVVKFVLRDPFFKDLIGEPDSDGNTPLHLATNSHNLKIVHLLLADERVDSRARNHKGLTPLDLASLCVDSSIRLRMHKIMVKLVSAGSQFSPQRMDLMTKKYRRKNIEEINRCRALANNLAIVAVLIATVTFAAAFTLPGGYENEGQHQGMAILGKKAAFQAFLISDAIAMVSSITVTCLLIYTGSFDHDVRLHSISTAMKFMWIALGGMVVAFATGTYVVVAPDCEWIAVLVCFMACSVPFIAWMIGSWPTFNSLKLVKAARSEGKKVKKTATFKVMDFQMPHATIVDFETPPGSASAFNSVRSSA